MPKYSTQTLKLTIPGTFGQLDARLDMPDSVTPKAFVIICHCFTCTKETITTSRIARGLAQNGFAVLRFDFTGLGNSEGNFADSNFSSMIEDIIHVTHFLDKKYQAPAALLGHSMGGTAVLAASTQIPSCKTVITIASPSEPSHVLHHFGKAMAQLESGHDAEIIVADVKYPVRPQFVSDVRNYDMQKQMHGYSKAIMAIRAEKDSLVKPKDAEEIIAYTSGDHYLLDLDQADHLFSDRAITESMIVQICNWLDKKAIVD